MEGGEREGRREGGERERERRGGEGGERERGVRRRERERKRDSDIICIQKIAAYVHQIL